MVDGLTHDGLRAEVGSTATSEIVITVPVGIVVKIAYQGQEAKQSSSNNDEQHTSDTESKRWTKSSWIIWKRKQQLRKLKNEAARQHEHEGDAGANWSNDFECYGAKPVYPTKPPGFWSLPRQPTHEDIEIEKLVDQSQHGRQPYLLLPLPQTSVDEDLPEPALQQDQPQQHHLHQHVAHACQHWQPSFHCLPSVGAWLSRPNLRPQQQVQIVLKQRGQHRYQGYQGLLSDIVIPWLLCLWLDAALRHRVALPRRLHDLHTKQRFFHYFVLGCSLSLIEDPEPSLARFHALDLEEVDGDCEMSATEGSQCEGAVCSEKKASRA